LVNIGHSGGQAAIGVIKLFAIAKEIVANSTAAESKDFETAAWLGQWIERSQPALGGRKPADLLDTPTGFERVARLLGSIGSLERWHRQAGTSCDELRDLGGWKSRVMVDRYAKFATEHLAVAAARIERERDT